MSSTRILIFYYCLLTLVAALLSTGANGNIHVSLHPVGFPPLKQQRGVGAHTRRSSSLITVAAASAAASAPSPPSLSTVVANGLGYVMGLYAFVLYVPILRDIFARGSAEGVSLQTWGVNVLSFALALIYPLKKGFALSTYVEIVGLELQSLAILGLVCFYSNHLKEFVLGTVMLAGAMGTIYTQTLSPKLLSSIQIVRLALDSYSLFPQILLNFRQRAFSYNAVTASFSFLGNAIRVFTTLTLVKDPLVLAGYIVGCGCNLLLLLQFFLYGVAKKP